MEIINFKADLITLKDLLKATSLIPTGGLAKIIIKEEGVFLNDDICFIPGKKLKKGDEVVFDDTKIIIV